MIDVSQAAELLNCSRQNIHEYIKDGRLKASKKGNKYWINPKDFYSFREEFFENRHDSKGVDKVPNESEVLLMQTFINDINSHDLDYDTFKRKYKNFDISFASPKALFLYKRNSLIKKDKEKGIKHADMAKTYDLSIKSIDSIVNQDKEIF